jgi:hypothetical protein
MTALYRISAAKTDLYYRAGLGWPKAGVVVDRAAFTPEAWAALTAETMLRVEPVAEEAEAVDAEAALRSRIRDVFPQLEAEDFNKNGTPKVSAVERLLPADERAVTGKLVAEVWADVKAGP